MTSNEKQPKRMTWAVLSFQVKVGVGSVVRIAMNLSIQKEISVAKRIASLKSMLSSSVLKSYRLLEHSVVQRVSKAVSKDNGVPIKDAGSSTN